MKIVQINATCGRGSTGKICVSISKLLAERHIENYILYSSGDSDYPLGIKCSDNNYIRRQSLKARLLGNWGFNSKKTTQKMISELERIKPDIVHLHNIHGHDCHLGMLFSYIKEKNIKVVWTFHDCWTFTGYCPHFTMAGCDKWKTTCDKCPQKHCYTWLIDRSKELHLKKRELFTDLDLTVVTPSEWLADIVKLSFFKKYPVSVINNGIDLSIFKPTESDFKTEYGLQEKNIVLGVAFGWGERKGLDVFLELAKRLSNDYRIVLVGTNDNIDKQLLDNMISIHCTQNQMELAQIYTVADVFVNPTREEVLGLTNIEALACGTPVVTFKIGGSPECVSEECGTVVSCNDVEALEKEIIRICTKKPYLKEMCINRAAKFDKNKKHKEYLELYERVDS